jgi:putative endonuclease
LGEDVVVRWYEDQGYEIVDRNWRRRRGEIDVIARGDCVLVICEVKTRSSQYFGEPSLAVGREKQLRIRRLAAEWLSENPWRDVVRFDVAEVIIDARGTPPIVRVIESAF